MLSQTRSWLGALAREASVYVKNLNRPGSHTLVIFPSQGIEDGAANLRGYLIAERLRLQGWRAIVCPKHLKLSQRQRLVRFFKPDVVLMQSARHELNRPRFFPGVPVIFDIDDADYIAEHSRAGVIECLKSSSAVIAGSRAVANYCRAYNDNVEIVWTGTPVSSDKYLSHSDRYKIVAWAASSPLGSPKEQKFLISVFEKLSTLKSDFTFRMYADDGSEEYRLLVSKFTEIGIKVETFKFLKYADFLSSLNDVSVGLAPLVDIDGFSGGKSFGKVLAYLDSGVPVLTHPVVDHPLFFKNNENGIMSTTAEDWAEKIAELLDNSQKRQDLADNGKSALRDRLSIEISSNLVGRILYKTLV